MALFISTELRPIFFPPPDSFKDAKNKIIGTWSGAEGTGHFEVRNEIDFHPDWTFILRVKDGNEDWKETTGYYEIDTVRDIKTHQYYFTVSLSTVGRGGYWYFKNSDKLYPEKWGSRFTKNLGLVDGLLWSLVVPCLIGYFPARFFWSKVNQWGRDGVHQEETTST
jgi:hypothetical protein